MPIRAIIFDCYGVLVTEGMRPFKKRHFSDNPDKRKQADSLTSQVDAGLISYHDFMHDFARLAGMQVAEVRTYIEHNVADEQLFDFMTSKLKPRFKLGMLSNAGVNRLDNFLTTEQQALFDAIALSYQIGASKPDAKAYQIIADMLDVAPDECVFIDDLQHYCAGAQAAGMRTIHHLDTDKTIAELTKLIQSEK